MKKTVLTKFIYFPVTRIVVGILVCVSVLFTVKEFITKPLLESVSLPEVVAQSIQHLLSIIILVGVYYILYRYYEKREISELSLKHFLKGFLGGLGLGIGLISLVIFTLFILGYYQILGTNDFSIFFVPLTYLAVAALLEEIVFRGIIYRILEEWLGTHIALLQSVIFGFAHLGNENVTMLAVILIILLGLVLSLMYTYTQRLWVPFSFHLGWNFAQLIYGSNLSGQTDFGTFFKSKFDGPELLVGSAFGIEDSILCILFTLALFVLLYFRTVKKGFIIRPSWKLTNPLK